MLLHVLAWGALLALPFVVEQAHQGPPDHPDGPHGPSLLELLPSMVLLIGLFYLNAYVLIPRLLYRRSVLAYLASAVAAVGVVALLGGVTEQPDHDHPPGPPPSSRASIPTSSLTSVRPAEEGPPRHHKGPKDHHGGPFEHADIRAFASLFVLAISTAFRLMSDRVRAEQLAQEQENETLKTELAFLRGQISPHFLFNILNSAVALARKKSDLLEPALLRLSSLLRYMLYESDERRVPLEKEVEYLQAYIELQLLRFGDALRLERQLPPHLESYQIEPMLLIPFVENAFKHGVGLVPDPVIAIRLLLDGPLLTFEVRNKLGPPDPTLSVGPERNSGIGLENVRRRLKLLYADDYTLNATGESGWYTATLTLLLR